MIFVSDVGARAEGPRPVKRVFRHLPFRDAALAVELNLVQHVAGAQADQLCRSSPRERERRLIGRNGDIHRSRRGYFSRCAMSCSTWSRSQGVARSTGGGSFSTRSLIGRVSSFFSLS